jgi:hypothetical protein
MLRMAQDLAHEDELIPIQQRGQELIERMRLGEDPPHPPLRDLSPKGEGEDAARSRHCTALRLRGAFFYSRSRAKKCFSNSPARRSLTPDTTSGW